MDGLDNLLVKPDLLLCYETTLLITLTLLHLLPEIILILFPHSPLLLCYDCLTVRSYVIPLMVKELLHLCSFLLFLDLLLKVFLILHVEIFLSSSVHLFHLEPCLYLLVHMRNGWTWSSYFPQSLLLLVDLLCDLTNV